MTSATERLRALLDERGVEWEDHSGSIEQRTVYMTPNGWCYVSTANDKWLSYVEYHDMTPEQAVEATLGRGTCEVEGYDDGMDEGMDGEWFAYAPPTWYLSCGHEIYSSERPHYCPNCGRKVVV